MADPVGPVFTGGFEESVIQGEVGEGPVLLFLPPGNNDALQCERKAPVCYSIPEGLRLTRNPAHNACKFRRIHFIGGFDETTACPLGSEEEGVYGRQTEDSPGSDAGRGLKLQKEVSRTAIVGYSRSSAAGAPKPNGQPNAI